VVLHILILKGDIVSVFKLESNREDIHFTDPFAIEIEQSSQQYGITKPLAAKVISLWTRKIHTR